MYHPAAARSGYESIENVSVFVKIKYGRNESDSVDLDIHEGETRESVLKRATKIISLQNRIVAIKRGTKKCKQTMRGGSDSGIDE
jgi:hypothetical protein